MKLSKRNAFLMVVLAAAAALLANSVACNKTSGATGTENVTAEKAGPKPTVSANGWQVPVDVFPPSPSPTPTPTQNDWLNLGWQTFVALDWPSVAGSSGQPDTTSTIGATAANGAIVPAVWNTFRDVSTVMLANGADPGQSYNQKTSIPASCPAMGSNPVAPGFQPLLIDASTFQQATIVKDYINQATNNPLVDQKGWYTVTQIFVDPSEYAYIQGNGYFQGSAQVTAYQKNGKLAPFPRNGQGMGLPTWAQYGALEIKASWRVLDPVADKALIPRYYSQWGYFMQPDGKTCQGPTLFGLIGLHILRLTPSTGATWFWASFEQVDNTTSSTSPNIPATLAAPGTPTNGNCSGYNVAPSSSTGNIPWNNSNKANNLCQVTPIPSYVQQVNQTWQNQLQGTVWQYYQMVDTLNPCSPGDASCYIFPPLKDPNNKINLGAYANTSIESYFQNSTCMDCHGFAAGNGAPKPFTSTNQIFTFVLLNAYYPSTTATSSRQTFRKLFQNPPHGKLVAAPGAKPVDNKYKKK